MNDTNGHKNYAHTHLRDITPPCGEFIEGGEVGVFFMGEWNVYEEPMDREDFTRWAIEANAKHAQRWSAHQVQLEATWTSAGEVSDEWHMLILKEVGT